jgi:formate dehydrogenase
MQVLAILYDGGKAAEEEPRLLGTVENKLGIQKWLESQGHEFIGEQDIAVTPLKLLKN